MGKKSWIQISGIIWLSIGAFLFYKGMFLTKSLLLFGLALFLGCLKGELILQKTAKRIVGQICSLSSPISFKKVYPLSYWLLILSMVALGFLCRYLPDEVRGFIDIAIGSALMYGARLYFRASLGVS